MCAPPARAPHELVESRHELREVERTSEIARGAGLPRGHALGSAGQVGGDFAVHAVGRARQHHGIFALQIKAGEIIYDTATESQEEADIKRGRAARKADEQAERDARAAQKAAKRAARERRRAAEDAPR